MTPPCLHQFVFSATEAHTALCTVCGWRERAALPPKVGDAPSPMSTKPKGKKGPFKAKDGDEGQESFFTIPEEA
jgi:hypothetical protein